MNRASYSRTIDGFLDDDSDAILGQLVKGSEFPVETTQRHAWTGQIEVLKTGLNAYRDQGSVYFEYSIPRLGKRIDVVAVIRSVIFVIEFKVGESKFTAHAIDQVHDYGLDLKNFHETSHDCYVAPILIATEAKHAKAAVVSGADDRLLQPITSTIDGLADTLSRVLVATSARAIDVQSWERGRYCPTPTIIEAATALYGGHTVEDISRNDATAINLTQTSNAIVEIIKSSQLHSRKSICFVTGVPGAGKTLVGLNIAAKHNDLESALYSVFLSGNGPLVAILREALARDKVRREGEAGRKVKKGTARSEVKAIIQNVHHFRDECLTDAGPPNEHVAIFDEAQRAWDLKQTSKFMQQKKGRPDFAVSEPEFLISCMNRHKDWAVVVCLVGGGQEINTGEAGISEWMDSLIRAYPDWHLHISSRLTDSEYGAGEVLKQIQSLPNVELRDELHLSVSMRSFRAENVSLLVKQLLDLDRQGAAKTLLGISDRYPIVVTRSVPKAKEWLRTKARGTERFGIVVSSKAQRLKPYAIDIRPKVNPINWFLDGKEDVRSSFYLEDVATEFDVQGLELDWACITWDADFRFDGDAWAHWNFVGDRWKQIKLPERQTYLRNAYRVLLTRARQGMVIVVPEGDAVDPTRNPKYYDSTYEYLCQIGFDRI